MSIKELMDRGLSPCDSGHYLGREVLIEAFGHRKIGRVCSVYRDEDGNLTIEVEWEDGTMRHERFPQVLKFTEAKG